MKFGEALMAALGFADDLVLCGDRKTIERYIEILSEWCADNNFAVNVKKCAIMPVGFPKKEPGVTQIRDERYRDSCG